MSGVDRVSETEFSASQTVAKVDLLVTPAIFKRLAQAARIYQKIRYTSLRFEVSTCISTNTSGGYVAAFVRDPTDSIDDLSALTAQQGSVTTKLWESAKINAVCGSRSFFTSTGKEVREYSPGRFVLMLDGKPSQPGKLVVHAHWTAELSAACYEPPEHVQAETALLHDLVTRENQKGVWAHTGAGEADTDFSSSITSIVSGGVAGVWYRLRQPVTFPSSSNNGRVIHWIYSEDGKATFPTIMTKTDLDKGEQKTKNLIGLKGDLLDAESPAKVSGECQEPSSSDSQMTMEGSQQLQKLCETLSTVFLKALKESKYNAN